MIHTIAIRREDKSPWERRAPLTPDQVAVLVSQHEADVVVQPSPQRAFHEDAYREAGARIDEDITGCRVVLGVKEIPTEKLRADTTYMLFAHVIKGQPYNMPNLSRMLELGVTLIDYEKVRDDTGHRLIHFGRFAGLAGTIDLLWTLGRRLAWEGIPNAFEPIQPAHRYATLAAAKEAVREAGARIRSDGLPAALRPLVFGITGRGNVSGGANEILDCLPIEHVAADALWSLEARPDDDLGHRVFGVVFGNKHVVEPREKDASFDKAEYRAHPERYRAAFHHHLPHLTALVNGIYWDERYPRLISTEDLRALYGTNAQPRLRAIADITADIEGAIEATVKPTDPENPVFVYDPVTRIVTDGWEGRGVVIGAVDFLPTELPVEASERFGDALLPFVPALISADLDAPFELLDLPPELMRAVIAHKGELTHDYAYISRYLAEIG